MVAVVSSSTSDRQSEGRKEKDKPRTGRTGGGGRDDRDGEEDGGDDDKREGGGERSLST